MSGEPTNQPATDAAAAAPVVDPAPLLADPAAPIDAKAPEGEKPVEAKPAEAAKPVVPEKYEFKAPEGQALDTAQLEAFEPVFKELGLTQEQAQKLIDTQFSLAPKLAEAMDKQLNEQMLAEAKQWADAAKADTEYGGAKFDESMKLARQGYAAFASDALKKTLVESGFANHPEFVRLFWNVGRRLAEDAPPTDVTASNSKASGGLLLYPSMQS